MSNKFHYRTIRKKIFKQSEAQENYSLMLTASILWTIMSIWTFWRKGVDWREYLSEAIFSTGFYGLIAFYFLRKKTKAKREFHFLSCANIRRIYDHKPYRQISCRMGPYMKMFNLKFHGGYKPYNEEFGVYGEIDLESAKFTEIQESFQPEYRKVKWLLRNILDQHPSANQNKIRFLNEIDASFNLELMGSMSLEENFNDRNKPWRDRASHFFNPRKEEEYDLLHTMHLFGVQDYHGQYSFCILHGAELGLFEFSSCTKNP